MKYTLLILLLSTILFTAAGCKSSNEAVQTESSTEAVTTTVTTATETTASQTKPTENTTTQQITTTLTTSTITVTLQPTTVAIPVTANTIIQPTTAAIPVTANAIIQPTTVDITVTTNAATTETATEDTEIEILEFISIEMYGYLVEDYKIFDGTQHITYKNQAYYLMHNAEPYSDSLYGQITCEEDVIKIAREIFAIERGDEFVELIESEYIEMDGELLKYERNVPPYTVEYYDAYDVWYINPNAPSGVTENGIKFGTPSMPPYLLIRGEDGKILGALI
ncbi:MAG: hypothetical protein IKJ60_10340 [Ruminococcus sp.]|nr:hypothetical protein [Ruminococcus sp.]